MLIQVKFNKDMATVRTEAFSKLVVLDSLSDSANIPTEIILEKLVSCQDSLN